MSEPVLEFSGLSPQRKRELLGRLLKQRAQTAGSGGRTAPSLQVAPEDRFEPFRLRDIQQAYWIGRGQDFELGNVGAHVYAEFDSPKLDLPRLGFALDALVRRHDMLRAIILPSGQQQVLPEVPPYEVAVLDLSTRDPAKVASELDALRAQLSHRVFSADCWPLFEVRVTVLPDARTRIHFSIDLLIADLRSIYILLSEWFQLYLDSGVTLPPLAIGFRDYVLTEYSLEDTEAFARAEAYWRGKIPGLPPAPELPLATDPASIASPRFTRRTTRLPPPVWGQLKARAERHHVTPASVLLTAFGRTLANWSRHFRLTVNVTIFNRFPFHPQVNHLVGDFTSLVLVGFDHSAPESFAVRCSRINEQLWEALDHRQFSGVRVLRELIRRTGHSGRAIMPVVFTCDLRHDMTSLTDNDSGALPGEVVYGVSQTPQVYLDHQVYEEGGGLTINWDAVEDVFPQGLLQDMHEANVRLLEALSRDEAPWEDAVGSLTPDAHRQLAAAANATDAPLSTELLQTLFARRAAFDPVKIAVASADRSLTYGELFHRADHLARRLRELEIRPNRLVGVVMEKGWEQVVAVLGILQSGGAYLPVDPDLPSERFRYLLEHGEVHVVLTQSRLDTSLEWPDGMTRLRVDEGGLTGIDEPPLLPAQKPDDLAYVIYTSGSTGLPKGVMIDHRGAVNTILDINERFGVGAGDRVLALASLSFDLSVYDIFGTLSAGATIVVPEASAMRDPSAWASLIDREQVTVWNSVPAMMGLLVDYAAGRPERVNRSLRLVLMSGDWVPVTLPAQVKALIEGVKVVSLGGATEASIWSILWPIEKVGSNWKSIPYGRPMRNQRFYVLDDGLEPRPVGVPGELYIGGVGLAKGYWRDEAKTSARFIVHPRTGERLYRTGDWGSYFPDGKIEFLGREDFQVKIQGYRVELGEIEAALGQHPDVRSAVALAVGEPRGAKRLLAYVVSHSEAGPTEKDLKDFLHGKLPQYMVPSAIVRLDALPLTANGKVDRNALPAAAPQVSKRPDGPTTPLAIQLNELIAKALNIDRIDEDANLMDLGATSLDMLRIGKLLDKEFGFRPTMQEFLRFPSVRGLVEYYEQRVPEKGAARQEVQRAEEGSIGSQWKSFGLVADPRERAEFKKAQPGLRNIDGSLFVQLSLPNPDDTLEKSFFRRRSHRLFAHQPIPFEQFGALLSELRQISPRQHKRRYASAGGLYPVQTYLHVKRDAVADLSEGIYYYDPRDHRLVRLSDGAGLDRNIHWLANRLIFDEAAFSLFLIAQLSAIAPLYQERSLHLATLEAGLISQLLETAGPTYNIGLCHVGDVNFDKVRPLFALDDSHALVHSLLGGPSDPTRDPLGDASEDPTVAGAASGATGAGNLGDLESVVPLAIGDAGLVAMSISQLDAEAILAPDIRCDAPVATLAEPSHIFVTGATGFLGAFLLQELLEQTEADIFCLVRASSTDEGRLKLRRSLERHSLWNERLSSRIIPVRGDLSEPHLGLDIREFSSLANSVDVIYHSGALVNLMQPYAELKASNVGGTREVLRLAARGKYKPVHLVSSVAVFPFEGGKVRREDDALDHGEPLLGGYPQSKWVAERLAAIARERGLPIAVYRPGTITGHSQTGIFSKDSYLSSLIRGCIELGSAPDLDSPVDMVPVDFVSKAIIALSRRPESLGNVFHLTNPRPIQMSRLIDWMHSLGYAVRRAPYESWKRDLFALGERFEDNALYPFGAFIAQLRAGALSGPRYDCRATISGLAGTSISCPPVDNELLRVYFSYFVRSGFLESRASFDHTI